MQFLFGLESPMRIATLFALALLAGCAQKHEPVVAITKICESPAETNCVQKQEPKQLVRHIVYFDFDNAVLPKDIGDILLPHSNYLIVHPDRKIFIEGLADETGDFNHNLQLGQRRAEAVKKALLVLGVDQTQIIVHSSGVIKPQSEVSLAKNRRVILTY